MKIFLVQKNIFTFSKFKLIIVLSKTKEIGYYETENWFWRRSDKRTYRANH